ncbi:MAG: TauD/TfdA family dioxygenase [Alphaproteobacteria bacterium]|nr:TauD/TfdA family dioxygenase [Alphaproteobacteria bacterium]
MLEIRPLAPEIGAEVTGFDMGKPLTDKLFEDIHAAWMRHMVLVFPDQPVSDEALLAFGRHFGELEVFHQDIIRSKRLPEIFRVSNVDEDGNLMAPNDPVQHQISLARRWHTDSSYREKPSVGSLLHGVEVTEEGGETMFANMAAVLRALPADLRREVEGRRARHDFENLHRLKPLKPLTDEERARMPPVWQPIVRRHPETGQASLYISPIYNDAVEGMDPQGAAALVERLEAFIDDERFIYRHRWRPHDVLLWDNRCTTHRVTPYNPAHRRIMHRTTIAGRDRVEAA